MFHDHVFHQLRVVYQEHTARWAALSPGITKPQFAVLAVLAEERAPLDQTRLGLLAAISKPALTELLRRMEESGLVAREPDPHDSRRRLVTLTPDGADAFSRAAAVAERLNEETLSPLSAAERDTLAGLLRRLRTGTAPPPVPGRN